MRPALIALFLFGCSEAPPSPKTVVTSACHDEAFEQSRFTVCDPSGGRIEIKSGLRSFAALEQALGGRANQVAFAMNGGMFDQEGAPIGLMIQDGRQLHAINRRAGGGNFHLLPNGVFLVRTDGKAEVVPTDRFQPSPDIAFATQSGPMLLIDGKVHPRFDQDGSSRYVRNGVSIGPDGKPQFVISEGEVSFGTMARFIRDRLHGRNALYFDGSVSSLWDPANHRMDSAYEIGPMVIAFRPSAASAPHREAPARS